MAIHTHIPSSVTTYLIIFLYYLSFNNAFKHKADSNLGLATYLSKGNIMQRESTDIRSKPVELSRDSLADNTPILIIRSKGPLGNAFLNLTESKSISTHVIGDVFQKSHESHNHPNTNYYKAQVNQWPELIKRICPKIIIDFAEYNTTQNGIKTADGASTLFNTDYSMEWDGINQIISSCSSIGISPRIIYMSTLGSGETIDWIPSVSKDSLKGWFDAKTKAETMLKNAGIPYTILRPCSMHTSKSQSPAILTTGPGAFGSVTYEAVAQKVLECVNSNKTAYHSLVVIDPTTVAHPSPTVRPYEFYEPLPFKEFQL